MSDPLVIPLGASADPAVVGRKAAGLARALAAGLPVPPGFTLTPAAFAAWREAGGAASGELEGPVAEALDAALDALEDATGRRLGDPAAPLLVAVRPDAVEPLPGLAETILHVGLTTVVTAALAHEDADAAFAVAARFLRDFGEQVLGAPGGRLERAAARATGAATRWALMGVALGDDAPPEDAREQLRMAVQAAFESHDAPGARYHRRRAGLADGMVVTVQRMVLGARGAAGGTGDAASRDPDDGRPVPVVRFRPGGQGRDRHEAPPTGLSAVPEPARGALRDALATLEGVLRDAVEVEFTVEEGALWLLQAQPAPRAPAAAVRIARDLAVEGVLARAEALGRVRPEEVGRLLRPTLAAAGSGTVLARGQPGSPGAATGRVSLSARSAAEFRERGEPFLLVRRTLAPTDIGLLVPAAGVLTRRGGRSSHAAVVARGLGRPAVVGCRDMEVERDAIVIGGRRLAEGEWLTIDGDGGAVLAGRLPIVPPADDLGALDELLAWADQAATLAVRANADTPEEARRARQLGARGIGLCRTEHMFFTPEALAAMRLMIVADTPREREAALGRVLPTHRAMFADIFRAMDGHPVTIRLLDPPLHEFLPHAAEDLDRVARDLGIRDEVLAARLAALQQVNPMLGHRGVRVGITAPEVYRAQTRAIFEAACEVAAEGVDVRPEIMIPLVSAAAELETLRREVTEVAEEVLGARGCRLRYRVGTMIEVPRACLAAKAIARHADFFSFGTNDLTQLVWGFSRDDIGSFLPAYLERGILADSPFAALDEEGVGELVRMGTSRGRHANARLVVGACGEHAGDPAGVAFFHRAGLDHVSCAPYRVPVARLAAAHAALERPAR